jgi:hypothetical protein
MINTRDISQLTTSERICGNLQRFFGEQAQLVRQMSARNRRRAVGYARDEAECGTPDMQEFAEPPRSFVDECDVAADAA